MPPMNLTRSQMLRSLAALTLVALAAPFERLVAAGRRAFELPPRLRKPVHSVKRDG